MSSEPLPDHYKALGVDKSADAAAIKSVYRKLVLKCHPDKVTDPTLKEQKQEEFHKIQQAYEVLVDERKRGDYDAHVKLEALRKEKAARGGTSAGPDRSARFEHRTAGNSSFQTNSSSRYATEERKPAGAYEDDHHYREESSRSRYDTYDAYPKTGSSPRTGRSERERSSRPSTDRTRSDRNKARDKDAHRNHKFVGVDSDQEDDRMRFEGEYKRRSQESRKVEERRSYEDSRHTSSSTQRKMSLKEEEALRYQHKSRAQVEAEIRPQPRRTASRDYYGDSARAQRPELRPEPVRRSSARPKERPSSSGRDRDRGFPEIVSWGEEDSGRKPPSFKHSSSSPANIEIPRVVPVRSQTAEYPRDHHRTSTSPPPRLPRAATMSSVPGSSSRRKEATVPRPSHLREAMTPEQVSPHHDYPSIPPAQPQSAGKSTFYHYPSNGSSAPRRSESNAPSHNTVVREPGRGRARSPSLGRPPIGKHRPTEANIPKAPMPPSDERSRKLYGEIGQEQYARGRQQSYSHGDVSFSKRYGRDDISFSQRGREGDRDFPSGRPPAVSRAATFVY